VNKPVCNGMKFFFFAPYMDEVSAINDNVETVAQGADRGLDGDTISEKQQGANGAHIPKHNGNDTFFSNFGNDPLDIKAAIEYGTPGKTNGLPSVWDGFCAMTHKKNPGEIERCIILAYALNFIRNIAGMFFLGVSISFTIFITT